MSSQYLEQLKKKGYWASTPEKMEKLISSMPFKDILDLIETSQKHYLSSQISKPLNDFILVTQEISLLNCNHFLSRVLLTYESVIVQDPIPAFDPRIKTAFEFGSEENPNLIRERVKRSLKWLVAHEALIREGIIILSPHHFFTKYKDFEKSKLLFENQFLGDGPTDLIKSVSEDFKKLVSEYAQVFPLTLSKDGSFTYHSDKFDVAHNIISIHFKNDPAYLGSRTYNLFELDPSSMKEDGTMGMYLPLTEPGKIERNKYENWRNDSLIKSALKRVASIEAGLAFANDISGVLFTESPFDWEILHTLSKSNGNEEEKLAMLTSQLNIPFLDNVRLDNIIKIRKNEESFYNFRQILKNACKEISNTSSTNLISKAKEIETEILKPELKKIKKDYQLLIKKYLTLASLEGAAFALSASTGGVSIVGGLIGAARLIPEIMTDKRELSKNNIYMLWRLKEKQEVSKKISNILI